MRVATVLLSLILVTASASSCANKLNPVRNQVPTERRSLDLDAMRVTDLLTGVEVDIGAYMSDHKLRFLLLMWGSEGCTTCKEKALGLRDNYLSKNDLFLKGSENGFELVGINTDTGSLRNRFLGIWNDPEAREARGYSFVKWHDAGGDLAKTFILPPDVPFGLPITALVDRTGLQFLYTSQDHYELDYLIKRVELTLAGKPVPPPPVATPTPTPTSSPTPTPTPSPTPTVEPSPTPTPTAGPVDLGDEGPGRLKLVAVKNCDGVALTLDDATPKGDVRFVQVDKGDCGTVCKSNAALLTGQAAITIAATRPAECQAAHQVIGGSEFFAKERRFDTLVRWAYPPTFNPLGVPAVLPEMSGPLTLAFEAASGRIVMAKDGALTAADVTAAAASRTAARAVDFALLTSQGQRSFHEVRAGYRYTVVAMLESGCTECVLNVKEWQRPGGLLDRCDSQPGSCQIKMLKTARQDGDAANERRKELAVIAALGVTRVDMMIGLDTLPSSDPGYPFYRFSEGFLVPYNHVDGDPAAWFYVFDRDGRIVFDERDTTGSAARIDEFLKKRGG